MRAKFFYLAHEGQNFFTYKIIFFTWPMRAKKNCTWPIRAKFFLLVKFFFYLAHEGQKFFDVKKVLVTLSSEKLRTMVKVITGHNQLNYFQHKIGNSALNTCEYCDEDELETAHHILCECVVFTCNRMRHFGEVRLLCHASTTSQKTTSITSNIL